MNTGMDNHVMYIVSIQKKESGTFTNASFRTTILPKFQLNNFLKFSICLF